MIFSMTGFASMEQTIDQGTLILELRSVNHRYLELHLKLDDALRSVEPLVREKIAAKLGRGKVECRLSLVRRVSTNEGAELNEAMMAQLARMSAQVQAKFPHSAPLTVAEILRWPGVVAGEYVDASAEQAILNDTIKVMLDATLQAMADSRAREGEKLKAVLLARLVDIEQQVATVKSIFPEQVQAYQTRLTAKLQEVVQTVDADRLNQEMVLFAQKVDVDEELSRLTAHVSEVRRILDAGGAAGKRLDFLMQELNREANTLGSKAISTEVSKASMALKLLIEQMREQMQNIE